ncbi:hypothetical protein ACHWQZ_G015396 [Mnemiopsis leidyi]
MKLVKRIWIFFPIVISGVTEQVLRERKKETAEVTPISVKQGKTKDNNENAYAAAHVVDRDLFTHAGIETDNGAGWLKLEFENTLFINKIKIYYIFYTNWNNPSGYCAQTVDNFKKCVDQQNNVDVSVYQGEVQQKSCGTLQLTYGLEQSDQIYTLICNAGGDTVKLMRNKETAEITPTRVTQGEPSTTDYAAAHAVDRFLDTKAVTGTDNGAGWLKLEFDKTYIINKVIIYYMFVTHWFNTITWCPQSESGFRSCVDQDTNVDVSVYQGEVQQKSCGTLQLTYGLEQSDQIYTLICNAGGDTVMLSKSTAGDIEVCEVVVVSFEGNYIIH